MSNYSANPGMVKVDFYKPGGKWYMTEAVDMSDFYHTGAIHEAVAMAIRDGLKNGERLLMQFIVLVDEPYHQNSHPVMLVPEWLRAAVLVAEDERYNRLEENDVRDKVLRGVTNAVGSRIFSETRIVSESQVEIIVDKVLKELS